jgi:hypothetical protein
MKLCQGSRGEVANPAHASEATIETRTRSGPGRAGDDQVGFLVEVNE